MKKYGDKVYMEGRGQTARVESDARADLANRKAERTEWIEWKN